MPIKAIEIKNSMEKKGMKNRNYDLSKKETELVRLLVSECEITRNIQEKLKRLFA